MPARGRPVVALGALAATYSSDHSVTGWGSSAGGVCVRSSCLTH
jgi:hypothetical protein